ncbi:GNAT family N-acetyltransferase [Vreelandella utahensis]|uniref:GNAT family N-acetyltransferase n=1 Tax=Vreelandella halophila TaxID=86177 RepID=UPI001C4DF02A|nr:GNAT family N-acetyltransferase [Halomonas utahensis]
MFESNPRINLTASTGGDQVQLETGGQTWQLSLSDKGRHWTVTGWEGSVPEPSLVYPMLDRLFCGLELDSLALTVGIAELCSLCHPAWQVEEDGTHRIDRPTFYQIREAWLTPALWPVMPEVPEQTGEVVHPRRPTLPDTILYRRYHPGLDRVLELRPATVEEDGERFHRWQNLPRVARFWEYPFSRERLDAMLDERRAAANSFPLILEADGDPVGYFETYFVTEDRLGPYCSAGPFDQGVHVLIGEDRYCGDGQTPVWLNTISHYLFLTDPRTTTLYGEPDAGNKAMLRQLQHLTWSKCYEFDFPHKRAALVATERDAFFRETRL